MNTDGRQPRFQSSFYLLVIGYLLIVGCWSVMVRSRIFDHTDISGLGLHTLWFAVEIVAGFYIISTVLKCLEYLIIPYPVPSPDHERLSEAQPRMGVLYLCCDDLDIRAFESLCRLRYPGPLEIFVHDDGRRDPRRLDGIITAIASKHEASVTIMRRPRREGGKPGAVNHVLQRIQDRCDYILLCDNDSTALDTDSLTRGLRHFSDPTVAAVQFRNRGIWEPEDPPLTRRLARAIDVFDVFATHQSRHGMMPFLGHNGLIRVKALEQIGGFTPGLLSDDIDASVKWYLSGWRVSYAREVSFGERAPGSYAAFRMRSRKWAFGCAQVIRRHAFRVLLESGLPISRRLGFLEFVGFYAVQILLLIYLLGAHIVAPLLLSDEAMQMVPTLPAVIAGIVVMGAIFMPTLVSCIKESRPGEWPALAWTCCLIYGSTGVETCRGILEGLTRGSREWIPTNGRLRDPAVFYRCALEAVFGAALFMVPLIAMPSLLLVPVSYLFISNYLFSLLILLHYRTPDDTPLPERAANARRLRKRILVPIVIAATLGAAWGLAVSATVRVEGSKVLVDDRPFKLKGIHYSPWPPGTGPGKGYAWPDDEIVHGDLDMIRDLNANTILIYDDAPPRLFAQAAANGLMVIQAFTLNWQTIQDDEAFRERASEVLRRVEEVMDEPNLLAWIIGHEVTDWVLDNLGTSHIESRLGSIVSRVRQQDGDHPVTHGNWPVTKHLDLPFLDIVSFNLYPLWPREVVVRGYEAYVRDVLVPLAGERPLWITEFGLNTLESTPEQQALTIEECWKAIEKHTAGGVVFSFADEWWKNYNNPIDEGDFWEREYAPEDEAAHDLDPEEYYGIVTDSRTPKPAYRTVSRMYSNKSHALFGPAVFIVPLVLLMAYTIYIFKRAQT